MDFSINGKTFSAPSLVFTLEKLGWIRERAGEDGSFNKHFKWFEEFNTTVAVHYAGKVIMGRVDKSEPLTVRGCLFIRGGDILKLREVNPVLISEVMRDLDMLLEKTLG